MNERNTRIRSQIISHYYRYVEPAWRKPRSLHWSKIVSSDGIWRWTKSDLGIRGRLIRHTPLHVYQTVMRIKSECPPRGKKTVGHLLGGPLFFDLDFVEERMPISLWRIIDSIDAVEELIEYVMDRGSYHRGSLTFSGFRGIHLTFLSTEQAEVIKLRSPSTDFVKLKALRRERQQLARATGYWHPDWDWEVSGDIWRVSRVPLSIHGESALCSIALEPPLNPSHLQNQLENASPFTPDRKINVRVERAIPLFTFVDSVTYGPFRKGLSVKLPIAVALHLIWQDMARPREPGPKSIGRWFRRGWRTLFGRREHGSRMADSSEGGGCL